MVAKFVPVVYDRITKAVKRWAVLDFDIQLSDPAFGPSEKNEAALRIPIEVYVTLRTDPATGYPALSAIQSYVSGNAP